MIRYKQEERFIFEGVPWKQFSVVMRGKHYGREETRDAWLWFLKGYTAARLHPTKGLKI